MYGKAIIMLAFLSIILFSCSEKKEKNKKIDPKKVVTILLEEDLLDQEIPYSGAIVPIKTTNVGFMVSGKIQSIAINKDEYIKKGELMATIDPTDYKFALDAAKAQFERAEGEYGRLKELFEKGSLTKSDYDKVSAIYKEAKADLNYKQKQLNDTKLYSPCEGWVSFDNLEKGEIVKQGIPVFQVIQSQNVYARFMVPENEIGTTTIGQNISVIVPAISELPIVGIVERIAPKAERFSRSFEVKALISNDDFVIKPGMIAQIHVSASNDVRRLLIPAESIVRNSNGETFVFIIENNIAKKRKVITDVAINNKVVVEGGIVAGDKLVTKGQHKLYENDSVIIIH